MTDLNTVPFTPGSGGTLATDNIAQSIGSVDVPISKLLVGDKGANDGLVSAANPLPMTMYLANEEGAPVAVGYSQALPISGDVVVLGSVAATIANLRPPGAYFRTSTAGTNDDIVWAGQRFLGNVLASNTAATAAYLKLYNAETVTVGTDVPVLTLKIPAEGFINVTLDLLFGFGICIGITTGAADSDTGAVGADEVKVIISHTSE